MAVVAHRPPRTARSFDRAVPWLAVAGVLVLFEILPRVGVLSIRFFPPMSRILSTLARRVTEGDLWTAVGDTLQGWALGLGIAAAVAIPLGILLGSSRLLYRAVRAPIEFLRPVPSVALVPLAVLIFGTGLRSKVFLASFAAFWQLLMQVVYGVQDVDPMGTDTARSFGFSAPSRLVHVTLPSTAPYIATGLRIASSVALILSVTAELVIGAPGLGREINLARSGGNVELMYALILATGLMGWFLNGIFVRIERRVLHWHPTHRSVEVSV